MLIDNVLFCFLELVVMNFCDFSESCDDIVDLENIFIWLSVLILCLEFEDVVSYNVYYVLIVDVVFDFIVNVDDLSILEFIY